MQMLCKSFLMSEKFEGPHGHNLLKKGFLRVKYALNRFLVDTTWRCTWKLTLGKGLANADILTKTTVLKIHVSFSTAERSPKCNSTQEKSPCEQCVYTGNNTLEEEETNSYWSTSFGPVCTISCLFHWNVFIKLEPQLTIDAPQSWELPVSQPLCKWLGLILGLNTWPVPSHPRKKGLVVERPNVCGLAATISPCWMKWKSCVVIGCCLCSVFYLKPQGCIFMLALWKCHLCFSSSVWLMHFLLPDVTLTCISHSTISKLNKGHLNPLWKFPSLCKVVDNILCTPVL